MKCAYNRCPERECLLNYEPQRNCWIDCEAKELAENIMRHIFELNNHTFDVSKSSEEYRKLIDFSEDYVIELRKVEYSAEFEAELDSLMYVDADRI